jgi:signal transduction histidine kinase
MPAIRQSAFAQALMAAVPCPLVVEDLAGRLAACNAAFERAVGRTGEELRGCLVAELLRPAGAGDQAPGAGRPSLPVGAAQRWILRAVDGEREVTGLRASLASPAGRPLGAILIAMDSSVAGCGSEALDHELRRGEDARVGLGLQRVRNAVLQMQSEEDWPTVALTLDAEMRALIDYNGCGINVVDREHGRYAAHIVDPGRVYQGAVESMPLSLVQTMEGGRPVYRRNRAEMSAWGDDNIGLEINSVVDVPFADGTLALNHRREDAFGPRDVEVLEQFAHVVSEAHRRLGDLHRLARQEEQLRQVQRLEAIGRLAAGVAHELNNPLMVVLGTAELLAGDPSLPPRMREGLEAIGQQGRRAADTVRRLANFAKRQQLARQPTDLSALVGETVDLVRGQLAKDGVTLVEDLAPGLPRLEVHPGQVQQIVLHLMENAREAALRGGIGALVGVTTRSGDGTVRLEVVDNGPGIAPELRERVFDPFYTTRRPGDGLELGLSLTYRMVREHGGRIWIEPREPGTCVVVELPL